MNVLTADEAQGVDVAFRRVMEGAGVRRNILDGYQVSTLLNSVAATMSLEAQTLFVTATGNDSTGDGSSLKPFATPQRAIDAVPDDLAYPTVISIGPGTFPGFRVDSKRPLRPATTNGAYLAIIGTVGTFTPTSGPSTGVASNVVAVNSTGLSTVQVVGATWVVDELKGKFFVNDTQGTPLRYIPIVSNTADTITFYGFNTYVANGETITIKYPTTVITGTGLSATVLNASTSATSYTSGANEGTATIRINNCDHANAQALAEVPALLLAGLVVTNSTRLRINNSKVLLRCLVTDGTSTSAHIAMANSDVTVQSWCSLGSGISVNGSTLLSTRDSLSVNLCFVERSAATGGFFGIRNATLTDTFIKGCTTGISLQASNYSLIRCGFQACTTAILCDSSNSYQNLVAALCAMNGGFFQDCTTGIDIRGLHQVQAKFWGGTGNSVAARVKYGARFGFRTDFNPAGVTEIEMDQANTTFAAVRAATPKVVKDASYDSLAYETIFT